MYWNFDDADYGLEIIKGWITLHLSFEFPCHLADEKDKMVYLHLHFTPDTATARRIIYNWLEKYFAYREAYDEYDVQEIVDSRKHGIFWVHDISGCMMMALDTEFTGFLTNGIEITEKGMKELESRLVKFIKSL